MISLLIVSNIIAVFSLIDNRYESTGPGGDAAAFNV